MGLKDDLVKFLCVINKEWISTNGAGHMDIHMPKKEVGYLPYTIYKTTQNRSKA